MASLMLNFAIRSVLLLAILFTSLACVTTPQETVVLENPDRQVEDRMARAVITPVQINPNTIVIDSRSPFDYSLAHIPRSISMQWSNFTQPVPEQRGLLLPDLFSISRRLAAMGISPSSHVVVIGSGQQGNGEEGRIAWMLAYLGVVNVQFTAMDALKARMVNTVESNPFPGVPVWKPNTIESLHVSRSELLNALNKRGLFKPIPVSGQKDLVQYRIIDVRSEAAYLGKEGLGKDVHVPNMGAVNIPWRDFFDQGMRPKNSVSKKIRLVGIHQDDRIIVLDEDGVASGAVTMALRGLGFHRAGHYAGGLKDLLASGATIESKKD
jgi:thiosulfate/3-mercaptopyruvate sulfurtransferase